MEALPIQLSRCFVYGWTAKATGKSITGAMQRWSRRAPGVGHRPDREPKRGGRKMGLCPPSAISHADFGRPFWCLSFCASQTVSIGGSLPTGAINTVQGGKFFRKGSAASPAGVRGSRVSHGSQFGNKLRSPP